MRDRLNGFADDFLLRVPQKLAKRWISLNKLPVHCHHSHADDAVLKKTAESRFAFA